MEKSEKKSALQMMLGYFRDFKVLKETPKEYWGVQVINFVDCTTYFALLTVVTLFLSEVIGFDDKQAGYVVTLFTSATTIMLLFSGLFTDWLGIRRSLYIALGARGLISLGIVALALAPNFPHRGLLVAGLFLLMAPAMAMVQTVFQAANKRFTTVKSRSAGFSLWYLFMNVGAMAGGGLVDVVRLWLKRSTTWVVGTTMISSLVSLVAIAFSIRNEGQYGDVESVENKDDKPKEKKTPLQILKAMLSESAFWRFLVLIALLLGVRAVFVYMYLLMPKYWVRVIGPDAAIGTLNMINPFLIVVGIVVFLPYVNRFNIFKMLVNGSMISALSLFALVIPWHWISGDFVFSYYAMAVICMVLLSIGEVIWSPKLSEYTAAIAPEGQEGSYLGMSMMPWFLAKTVVSVISGHMLVRWVPEGIGAALKAGTVAFWNSPEAMWLILALVALGGPVLARLLQGWLTKGARWKTETGEEEPEEKPSAPEIAGAEA